MNTTDVLAGQSGEPMASREGLEDALGTKRMGGLATGFETADCAGTVRELPSTIVMPAILRGRISSV